MENQTFGTLGYFLYFLGGLAFLYWLAYILASWLSLRFHENRFVPLLQKLSPFNQAIVGVLAGIVTPFCSCSTIPIFLGLLESQLPRRTAMSFLIASPLVSPPALILSLTLLGWQITSFYVLFAMAIALVVGQFLAQEALQDQIKDFLFLQENDTGEFSWRIANMGALRFLVTLAPALIIAGGIAVALQVWGVPLNFIQTIQASPQWSIPAASFLGGILYADLIMVIPIAKQALLQQLPVSIVLPFLMAASGIGIPSLILLSRIFKWRLMLVYVTTIFVMINIMGFVSIGWMVG